MFSLVTFVLEDLPDILEIHYWTWNVLLAINTDFNILSLNSWSL